MTKTNIDLGASTSFGASASVALTAGIQQSTTVGFDSTTKFLFQSGWNLSALNMACSYSYKEWLITGKKYRTTGAFAKFATKSIDAGCKSFFAGGETVNISSKDKMEFLSDTAIRVRVGIEPTMTVLAGSEFDALSLYSYGDCKVTGCTDIGINVGRVRKNCVKIKNTGPSTSVLLHEDQVKVDSNDGVKFFLDAVSVGRDNVSIVNNSMVATTTSARMLNLTARNGLVQISDRASLGG